MQRLALLMRSLSSWSSALFSGSTSSFALKQHTQIQGVLAHTLKVAILTSYKKISVGYFELKLHIHTLGISETYFASCKKEHNRSPLSSYKFLFLNSYDSSDTKEQWFPNFLSKVPTLQVKCFTLHSCCFSLGAVCTVFLAF